MNRLFLKEITQRNLCIEYPMVKYVLSKADQNILNTLFV